jgi:hypothetical protein
MMTTFKDLFILPREVEIEQFGLYSTSASTLVLKRCFNSYMTIEKIPSQTKIAYIIRHPFDVLTSHNPTTDRKYHIHPSRWLGEMRALKYLLDFDRPNTLIIKYEDLVENPIATQKKISAHFNLEIESSVDEIDSKFNAPPEALSAMHGLRKIDKKSVYKFKSDISKIHYLESIKPKLGEILNWVSKEFDYNIYL